jgi:hypothetical protein
VPFFCFPELELWGLHIFVVVLVLLQLLHRLLLEQQLEPLLLQLLLVGCP